LQKIEKSYNHLLLQTLINEYLEYNEKFDIPMEEISKDSVEL